MAPRTIFISYAHENRPEVEPSAELLRAGGVQVFIDVAGIAYGDRWQDTLQQALDQCERVMVFWSLAAKASEWVDREWRYALQMGKRIVPTLLDDTPLPPELSQFQTLSQRRSPADAAATRGGRTWLPTAVAVAAALALGAAAMWWFEDAQAPTPTSHIPSPAAPAPRASERDAPVPEWQGQGRAMERSGQASEKLPFLDFADRVLKRSVSLTTASGVKPTAIEEVRAELAWVFSPQILKLMDREDLLALAKAVNQARQSAERAQSHSGPDRGRPESPTKDQFLEPLRAELERASAAIGRAQLELDSPTPAPVTSASSAPATTASVPVTQPSATSGAPAAFGVHRLVMPIGLGLLFCAGCAAVWMRRGKRGSRRAEASDYVARVFGA